MAQAQLNLIHADRFVEELRIQPNLRRGEVAHAEQVAFLRANNCDEIQGYYFSKPVSSDAIEALLKR